MLGSILARGIIFAERIIFNVLTTLELDHHLHKYTELMDLGLLLSPAGGAEPHRFRFKKITTTCDTASESTKE